MFRRDPPGHGGTEASVRHRARWAALVVVVLAGRADAQPALVRDINLQAYGIGPQVFSQAGGVLFFQATDGAHWAGAVGSLRK